MGDRIDRAIRRITYALNDYRTLGLEAHLAGSAMAAGAWIMARGLAKQTFLSNLSPILLGALIAGHGVLYAHALLAELKPYKSRTPKNRALCLRGAVFSVFLWATLFVSFMLAPPRISLAIPLVFANTLGSMWAATRLWLKASFNED